MITKSAESEDSWLDFKLDPSIKLCFQAGLSVGFVSLEGFDNPLELQVSAFDGSRVDYFCYNWRGIPFKLRLCLTHHIYLATVAVSSAPWLLLQLWLKGPRCLQHLGAEWQEPWLCLQDLTSEKVFCLFQRVNSLGLWCRLQGGWPDVKIP